MRSTSKATCVSLITALLWPLRSVQLSTGPVLELWPLSFVALIPVITAHQRGAPLWVTVLSFSLASAGYAWSIAVPLVVGVALGCPMGILWGLLFRVSEDAALFAIVVGAFWTCLEYLIIAIAGTMPNLATPLYAVPSLIQPISLVGCHGLNFFVGAVNGGIAQVLSTSSPHRRSQTLRSLFFGISLWVGVSVVQYSLLDAGPGRTATVAAIAPGGLLPSAVLTCRNGTRSHFGEALPCNASLKEQIEWTRRVVVKNNAKMVVWSEAWVGAYENRTQLDAAVNHTFAPLAKELGILLTIGMHTMDRSNLAVTISPTGDVLGYYGKMNPVQLLGERNPTQYGYRDFDIRPDWLGYTESKVRVGPLICYDMDFPASVATLKRRGVEIVLIPSSDWSAIRNHIAAYVFRAIENRMPIVKADTGWDSAIVDARGNVIASYTSQVSRRHVAVGTVKLGFGDPTVAAVYGNLVPLVCFLFLVSWKFVIIRSDGHVKLA